MQAKNESPDFWVNIKLWNLWEDPFFSHRIHTLDKDWRIDQLKCCVSKRQKIWSWRSMVQTEFGIKKETKF